MKDKILAVVGIGLVAGGFGLGYGLMPQKTVVEQVPVPKVVEKEVVKEVPVQKVVEKEVVKEVPVPAECEVTPKEMKKVQENLETVNKEYEGVLDFVYDVDGNTEFLLNDLEDDEIDQISDRIGFIYDSISLAEQEVNSEFADELDDETFNGTTFDEDDVEDIELKTDLEDIHFDGEDFSDNEIDLSFQVEFEQDDVDYVANVTVEIDEGEVEDFDVNDVVEE